MTIRLLKMRGVLPIAANAALALSLAANAQTSPGGAQPASRSAAQPGQATGAQQPSPTSAQSTSPPDADTPASSTTQPAYPSSDPPRGTTPQQRRQQGNMGAAGANSTMCNQEDRLARSECLRRDMTDDEDRPAGVTRSMQQRKQQAQQQAESTNVASEADTGSDQTRGRTRTASSDLPGPERAEEQPQAQTNEAQPSDTEANNASDTLGRER